MTPEEIKNESMRVQKAKEIEEVDTKVEKDMIELTILEAAENIEKYQKETKAWKDRKVVRKDIKTGDLVLKRKKIVEKSKICLGGHESLHRRHGRWRW
jgi:histidinol dehydrogenase